MAQRINYDDKVGIEPKETHINQIWDDDMNNIKLVVNANATETESNTTRSQANEAAIANIPEQPFESVQMATTSTPPAYSPGLSWFDGVNYNKYDNIPGTSLQEGKEVVVDVINNNGSTLNNFTVVRYSNSVEGFPSVVRAQADTVANASGVSICTHDILVGEMGKVTLIGTVSGNTSAWAVDDVLYLSATVSGELTNVEQPILNRIGRVLISDSVNGSILVYPSDVINLTAIGQAHGTTKTQDVTTTPAPLRGYNPGDILALNTEVAEFETPIRVAIRPLTVGSTGFYRVCFNVSLTATSNRLITFEVYQNGAPTGVTCLIDTSNNNIDSGSGSINAITTGTLFSNDFMEVYVFADGNNTLIYDSISFNIERIGNV